MQKLLLALLGLFFTATSHAQGPSKEGPSVLTELFYQAETFRITGRTGLAMQSYERMLKQDAENETALYQLARIMFAQADYLAAQQLLARGTTAHPDNEWIWRLQAQNARQLGDFTTALASFRALQELRPDKLEYLQESLQSASAAGLTEEAISILESLETLFGMTPETVKQKMGLYLQANDIKGAEKVLRLASETQPQRVEYLGLLGQFYDGNGQSKKAIKVLKRAVSKFPENAPIAMEMARVLQSKGDLEGSIIYLEKALRYPGLTLQDKAPVLLSLWEGSKKDSSMVSMVNRSWEYTKILHGSDGAWDLLEAEKFLFEGDLEASALSYRSAIEKGLDAIEIYQQLLAITEEAGLKELAIEVLDDLQENYTQEEEIQQYVVFSYYQWKDWARCAPLAAEHAQNSLIPSTKKWLLDLAAHSYFALDSVSEGIKNYELSLSIDRDAGTLNNYAWELGKRGVKLHYALELVEESNAKSTLDPTVLDTWAWVLYKMNRFSEAQTKMALALQLLRTKPDAVVFRHAADIEKALGNTEKSVLYRSKANEIEGKNER
jgi:tetratricopeptide (TPR) repeat protein